MRVELTKTDLERCAAFGRMVVEGYATGKKDKSKALSVPGKPTIHDNPEAQANGRLAELAFVRAAGFPDDYLNWSDKCDRSYDIKLHNLTIDIKSSTNPRAKRLMWPVSKNHFIQDSADILVFVKLQTKDSTATAELAGWIGHHTFLAKAKTSDGTYNILEGTKYMDADELSDIRDLFHITAIAAVAQENP